MNKKYLLKNATIYDGTGSNPFKGNVLIDNYNVSKVEPKDRNIAMVFQSYALYPSMNVRENMIFGLKQAKVSKEKIEEQLSLIHI